MSNPSKPVMNRRRFLKTAGLTLGASTAACLGLGFLATRQPAVQPIETYHSGENAMQPRILVTYASKTGSTAQVAEAIGQTLSQQGMAVDIVPVDAAPALQPYQAVILGSAIRQGRWIADATRWVETQQAALRQIPIAYFTCCMTLSEESEQNRSEAVGYMDPVSSLVQPVAVGAFAGKMEYSRLSFIDRMLVKAIGVPEGDFRPWEAIRAWASSLPLSA